MFWYHNKSITTLNLWDEQLASEKFTWVDGVAVLTNLLMIEKRSKNSQRFTASEKKCKAKVIG